MPQNDYAADVEFIATHAEVVELSAGGDARIAVVPGYQGRVMTSTLAGGEGTSFGFINYDFIAAGKDDPVFNNYGGEDRFWLGPEGGQFSLWFRPDAPMDTDHWFTPKGFSSGAFEVTSQNDTSIEMTSRFDVTNYSDTKFDCALKRTVNALDVAAIAANLNADIPGSIKLVAYESVNTLTNAGDANWTRETGLLSIWILGMLKPLPQGKVIVPFVAGDEAVLGKRATTDYFGEIPSSRCTVTDDCLLLACDGKFRCKIGVSPARSKDILGSYDPDLQVLTIAQFNLPTGAASLPYVNSLWEIQDSLQEAFAGDTINSYNDGESTPDAGQLGPFYELETSSPAAELKPGESITHTHRTCHMTGELEELNDMSKAVLGVDLTKIY